MRAVGCSGSSYPASPYPRSPAIGPSWPRSPAIGPSWPRSRRSVRRPGRERRGRRRQQSGRDPRRRARRGTAGCCGSGPTGCRSSRPPVVCGHVANATPRGAAVANPYRASARAGTGGALGGVVACAARGSQHRLGLLWCSDAERKGAEYGFSTAIAKRFRPLLASVL